MKSKRNKRLRLCFEQLLLLPLCLTSTWSRLVQNFLMSQFWTQFTEYSSPNSRAKWVHVTIDSVFYTHLNDLFSSIRQKWKTRTMLAQMQNSCFESWTTLPAVFLIQLLPALCKFILLRAITDYWKKLFFFRPLRYICCSLQRKVREKWAHDRFVRARVVSGFIFLRLICPAILNPRQFNLLQEPPHPMASRSLIMVAKCLQNLANLIEFGGKEPYMEVVNPFILKNKERMINYLDMLSVRLSLISPLSFKLYLSF